MGLEAVTTLAASRERVPPGKNDQPVEREPRPTSQEPETGSLLRQNKAEELTPALEKLNKTAPIYDFRFHFKIHEATRRIMVQVIDKETGEVLNEIPPEKILDLVARIQELVGLLVDEKV